ncbi:NUDIX hydrolase [Jiella sonneratiae]|uniref:NUDIX domain-containing protein n=1 Tax=Jiella sonneratiae TaxID=2816856 RepID=A0ABS3IZ87_9HYPH|nr:NUDIX domain-containing protein [Jiella sonneratiae]MBO0902720.1 NUDIX domain-containing protein [Jiella sonneratiae]
MIGDGRLDALEAERRAVQAKAGETAATMVRDAATLAIVDRSRDEPRFLMGLRGPGHVFMANRFVFPGGAVEPGDLDGAGSVVLAEAVAARLTGDVPAGFAPRDAAALVLAAIRETHEETGLFVARPQAPPPALPGGFAAFSERGLAPAFDWLVPVARAITPEGAPRRYDTRFFVVDAARLGPAEERFAPPTDEFAEISWVGAGDLAGRSVAPITRTVLDAILARLADGSWLDASRPMPFYRVVDGRFRHDLI